MSEILHIKNFGPINEVKLDLGKINVFIGDQGSGKSTVAKLLHSVRKFCKDVFDRAEEKSYVFDEILGESGIKAYLDDSTQIKYEFEGKIFERINGKINYKISNKENDVLPFNANELYVLAERQMIPVFSNALYDFNSKNINLPKYYNDFGSMFNLAKKEKTIYNYDKILGVNFQSLGNEDVVSSPKINRSFRFTEASTGVQGTIPFLVILDFITSKKYIARTRRYYSNYSIIKNIPYIIIEEPELNLFPITQNKLLKEIITQNYYDHDDFNFVISELNDNRKSIGEVPFAEEIEKKYLKYNLLITTHSPYILTSLNNLMYAYQIGQIDKEATDKVIEEKYWVNPKDVRCYLLENGKAESILDSEGLIKTSKIDSVSGILNKEFNDIMDIELNIKK